MIFIYSYLVGSELLNRGCLCVIMLLYNLVISGINIANEFAAENSSVKNSVSY